MNCDLCKHTVFLGYKCANCGLILTADQKRRYLKEIASTPIQQERPKLIDPADWWK